MPDFSRINKVQEELIETLQERGVKHTLEWISSWYNKAAEATIRAEIDEMKANAPEGVDPTEAIKCHLIDQMMRHSNNVDNKSTSIGANAMKEAMAATYAQIFQREYGHMLRADLESAFDEWRQARDASTPKP